MSRKQRSLFDLGGDSEKRNPESPSMGGVIDWFRKFGRQEKAPQLPIVYESKPPTFLESLKRAATGLPIERPQPPERGIIPAVEKGISRILSPISEMVKAGRAGAPPKEEKPITPPSSEKLAVFKDVLSPEQLFEIAVPRPVPAGRARREQAPLWTKTRWQMPTTFQLVEKLKNSWELPDIWETVLSNIESPSWEKKVREAAHRGEPAFVQLQLLTSRLDPYGDMAHFLGIPDAVIDVYAEEEDGVDRFEAEVIKPLSDRVGKALDILKPTHEIFGWFELVPDEDLNYWLVYFEQPVYPERP